MAHCNFNRAKHIKFYYASFSGLEDAGDRASAQTPGLFISLSFDVRSGIPAGENV